MGESQSQKLPRKQRQTKARKSTGPLRPVLIWTVSPHSPVQGLSPPRKMCVCHSLPLKGKPSGIKSVQPVGNQEVICIYRKKDTVPSSGIENISEMNKECKESIALRPPPSRGQCLTIIEIRSEELADGTLLDWLSR